MEEKIKILEEQVESCKKYFEAYKDDESFKRRETYKQSVAYCDALESLINGYRTLEKHLGFYEKNGSYKARIFELQDKNTELEEQVEYLKHEVELRDATVERLMREKEELKNLANNTQWISPCYVSENYIAKEKVDNLLKELLRKLDEHCDDRWEKDNKDYYTKIKAQINIIKQLKEG